MMVVKKTLGGRIFTVFNTLFMLFMCVICFVPILHVFWASISDPALVETSSGILLRPLGDLSLNAYKIILRYKGIWTGYKNTIFYVVAQCLITGVLTVIAGYVLSRKRFRYRNTIMMFLDTYWACLIPGAMSVFYIIIMRTAIQGIPDSLEESARLDGAGEFTVMFRVILPLCKATFAVIILFIAVGKWNSWFDALLYLPQDKSKYPLQMYMREILINNSNDATSTQSVGELMDNAQLYKTLVKYGSIIVSTVPILCVYPFVQKYFVTGVMVGSVKG